MGAPASLAKWIPEDDLLLKNAVENGASLESLAKGAVCFSRRFTIQELQDRWRSMLYDFDTSSEASAHIIGIEIELSASNTTKTIRNCSSIGKDNLLGKRKGGNIRRLYYAMRKRVFNGPCCSTDLSFFVPPGSHGSIGTCDGYEDPLKPLNEHHCNDFATGVPTSDHYGHFETGYDSGLHVFPDGLTVTSADANCDISHHTYQTGLVGSVEDELLNGVGKDGLYGYTENILPVSDDNTRAFNVEQSFDHTFTEGDNPQITEDTYLSFRSCSNVQEIELPHEFSRSDLYENDNIEAKPIAVFDSSNGNHGSLSSDFIGKNNLASQTPECNSSLQQLGYSSVPTDLPIWRIDDIPAPTIPMDVPFEKQGQGVFSMDDLGKMDPAGCDGNTYGAKLDDGICSPGLLDQSLISEDGFMDFPDSYMDFEEDGNLLFMDVDRNGITDRSCLNGLSSILLNSPSDEHQDDVPNSSNHISTEILDPCFGLPDGLCSSDPYDLCDQMQSGSADDPNICAPEINLPSTLSGICATTPLEEFKICTLNTEDLDIPCNDDFDPNAEVLPQFPTSDLDQAFGKNAVPVSSFDKVLSSNENAIIGDLSTVNEEMAVVTEHHKSSVEAGSSHLPKVSLMPSSDDCKVEAEPFRSSSIAGVSGHTGIAMDNCLPCISAAVPLQFNAVAEVKEESKYTDLGYHGYFDNSVSSFFGKSVHGPDGAKSIPLDITDGCEQEAAIHVTSQKDVASHVELVSAVKGSPDLVVNVLSSDQEGHSSGNENDVPSFSDIESMILDMDLIPYDEESCLFATEVSRYQSVDAKKAIIRLEQGASSHMNRAISSHGGFAIFYGRHLKYFMKEREISLGRATEELEIDIDLGREGPANKISRLQAFIKLEEDGTFALRNVGKCSVFVNGKEIQSRKRTSLASGSLIEIKEMRFMFEVNQNALMRYIRKLQGGSQEMSTQFDWVPCSNS